MSPIGHDLRHAVRTFARRPTFAVATSASLALAIAANAAVFSVVNAALFKPLPGVTRPERLVEISRSVAGESVDMTFTMYRHLAAQPQLEGLAALSLETVSIGTADVPSVRGAAAVTASYFDLLGTRPQLGRVFSVTEASYPAVAPVAVISWDVWQREFSGASDIIGRVVRMNGTPVEIIGVLPRGFAGHHTGLLLDVFLPIGLEVPGLPTAAALASQTGSSVELLGRLRPGVTTDGASTALGAAANMLALTTGEATATRPYAVRVDAWGPLPSVVRGAVAGFLGGLTLLVTLALAMAGMNVMTILLARTSERRRELAVRRALGASEARLAGQLVTEAMVLFSISGVAGVGLARWLVSLIGTIEPPVPLPGRLGADLGFDWRVAGFVVLVTLGGALLVSLWPSLGASRFDVARALRETGASDTRGRVRLRTVLVGVQVAVTSVLLAATLILGRAFETMRDLAPGWDARGVVITSFDLELNGTSRTAGPETQRRLLERVSAIPGVETAALATKTQRGGRSSFGLVTAPGADVRAGSAGIDASLNRVSPGYLDVLRIPLLAGRDISIADDASSPNVAIINATMARRLFPSVNPVGRSFQVLAEQRRSFRVIGVAADAEFRAPGQPPSNFYYVPLAQWYNSAVNLTVRATPDRAAGVSAAIARAFAEVDPSLPYTRVRPLSEALDIYLLPQRLAAWIAGMTGLFGLLLAAVGIYGVTAFLVMRRAREAAIRLALGATGPGVAMLLLRQGSRAPLVGLIVGMLLATGLSFGVARVLAGAHAGDAVALIATPVVIAGVTLLAMLMPVQRLLRGAPMLRLRDD